MDLLLQRALDFEKITHYKYKYIMGKRGKLYIFEIDFRKADFHHLIGLRKLTDIEAVNGERETVFNKILNGEITYDMLKQSSFFQRIHRRFDLFANFTKIFNDENTTYKYAQDFSHSHIPADYLFTNDTYGSLLYVFITKRDHEDLFCCNSFFPFETFRYEKKQMKLTMLKVERTNLDTNETEVIFRNKNFME